MFVGGMQIARRPASDAARERSQTGAETFSSCCRHENFIAVC
ncbi:hypothetical protein DDI_3384 [Dickeya dianthicola RNS04.9]|nr:hypothetical protein DDI_3384 [Dickeya dianthicola RNS04.9]